MNHLSQRDVDGALSVLAEADATSPYRPFAPELVGLLGNLVGAECESYYCEFDFNTHAVCHMAEHLAVECPDDIRTAFLSLCRFYPLRDKSVGNATEALTLSDFQSAREQRRNPCIQEGLRPLGIQHELRIFLPAPTSSSRSFTFTRGPGRDFDQRDRAVLQLLRPHLARLRQRWEHNIYDGCLTRREHEIIHLLATGMRNREIADQLVISTRTVKKHLDNIYDKLGVHTRTGAVAAAHIVASRTNA